MRSSFNDICDEILTFLSECYFGATLDSIAEETGLADNELEAALNTLLETGEVRVLDGFYTIPRR